MVFGSKIKSFQENPNDENCQALERIVYYIKGSRDKKLSFTAIYDSLVGILGNSNLKLLENMQIICHWKQAGMKQNFFT